jgi:Zn finger protein HypA/HybF involved in hydrogenase expression
LKKERPEKRYTTEKFVRLAKDKHGDTYEYKNVHYTFSNVKVSITCKVHGDFMMTPANHLTGLGCDKCADARNGLACRKSQEQYLQECYEVWGDTYDYSLLDYVHAKHKVKIRCRKHGVFEKIPNKHLNGQGCPRCATSGFKIDAPAHLYVLSEGEITKVGITNREVKERVRTIRKSSGKNFKVVETFLFGLGKNASDCENLILEELRLSYRQPQEKYDGSTESFYDVDISTLLSRIEELIASQTAAQAA